MKSSIRISLQVLSFVALAALAIYLAPKYSNPFKYHFEIGQPWAYGLVTAQSNFAIYKSDAQLEIERQQVLRDYTPCYVVDTGRETYDDTACFVTKQGKPNPLYYWMQRIHGEMQKMAKILLKFNFEGMKIYLKDEVPGDCNFAREFLQETKDGNICSYDFKNVRNVEIKNGGVALITELYDKKAKRYGYYIVNATDPEMNMAQEIDITFVDCNAATVLYKGEETTIKFADGEGRFFLECGQGVFVLPY